MNNYKITYIYGQNENESCIEVYNVKNIAYDQNIVVFLGNDDQPVFILKHDKYFIGRI